MKKVCFKKNLICFIILLFGFSLNNGLIAQNPVESTTSINTDNSSLISENMVLTGAPFLSISSNPVAASLGNSSIASIPNSYDALESNSKLHFLDKKIGGNVTYYPWFSNLNTNASIYFFVASGFYKYKQHLASFSMRYLNYGQSLVYNSEGELDPSTTSPIDFSFKLGYTYKINKSFAVGIKIGNIFSRTQSQTSFYDLKQASTVAADVSLTYKKQFKRNKFIPRKKEQAFFDPGLNYILIMASITNLGGKLQYSSADEDRKPLPSSLNLGFTYVKNITELNRFSTNIEIKKMLVPIFPNGIEAQSDFYKASVFSTLWKSMSNGIRGSSVSLGLDYTYNDMLTFRSGYHLQFQSNSDDFLSLGAGFKISPVGLDFSYLIPIVTNSQSSYISPLFNTFRLGLYFSL